jgi:hypothetical protein
MVERISKGLLTKAKAAVLAGATEKDAIEKSRIQGRDLLSLLVKANMATDIPENQRLPDKDVLARTLRPSHVSLDIHITDLLTQEVPTFLVAGHETTRYDGVPRLKSGC